MTIKERDELLADGEKWYADTDGVSFTHWHIIARIILALPVEAEPAACFGDVQPKPSMSAAVRELVRAAEAAWNHAAFPTGPYFCDLRTAIAAVKDLFVEEPE